MNIQRINNTNTNFEARTMLNNRQMLGNSNLKNLETPLDAMFNENGLVRYINTLSSSIIYNPNPNNLSDRAVIFLKRKLITILRILADRIFVINNIRFINKIQKRFVELDPNSPEYIDEIAKVGKTIKDKYADINIEDGIIEELGKSDTPSIFVMNHPNYHKDKLTYLYLNSLLNQAYVSNSKQSSCPRPKIIVSKNLLNIVYPKIASIYKQMGMVPVDASLTEAKDKQKYNINPMKKIFSEFVNGRTNLFFFPEGNNSIFKEKTMRERLQNGIAEFIIKALSYTDKVRVVPVKLEYGKEKQSIGNITIREPLIFSKKDKKIQIEQNSDREIIRQNNSSRILDIISDNIS